jgi:hypothetical protein
MLAFVDAFFPAPSIQASRHAHSIPKQHSTNAGAELACYGKSVQSTNTAMDAFGRKRYAALLFTICRVFCQSVTVTTLFLRAGICTAHCQ